MNLEKYILVGVGDFSHGVNEIWTYRQNILNQILKTGRKPKIFIEDLEYGPKNIQNDNKIHIDIKKYDYRNSFTMMRYTGFRIHDSPTYLKFIRFIKKNNIQIIGVDPDNKYREKEMADNIIKYITEDANNRDNDVSSYIYIFFGHNFHIDDRKINYDSPHEYTTGHFLKEKFQDKYCVILSCGLGGSIRFDGTNGYVSKNPVNKNYMISKKKYCEIINTFMKDKKTSCWSITVDKNDILKYNLHKIIIETGWSFTPNWSKNNLINTKADYLVIFRHTTALQSF